MFKKIKGYNYEVSDDGQVKNMNTGRILKLNICKDGYVQIDLWKNGKIKWYQVHRLILETFIGPCPKGMEACHNNGKADDNRVVNLRWDTHKNNIRDQIKHGTYFVKARGSKNGRAKLNKEQVVEIRKKYIPYSRTASTHVLAKEYGVNKTVICDIVNNKIWKYI